MSENKPAGQPATPPVKTRNPVERIIVWGLIGGLLVLLAVEANSWWQQKEILNSLAAKVKAAEESTTVSSITEIDVQTAMGGKKPVSSTTLKGDGQSPYGARRIDKYSWFTLSPVNKRDIYVFYGAAGKNANEHAEVIAIQPDDLVNSPSPPPQVATGEQPPNGEGGGPGGRRGGRRGLNNGTSDAENKPDGDKPDGDKPDGDKPDADKEDGDKPDATKPTEKTPADTDKDSE